MHLPENHDNGASQATANHNSPSSSASCPTLANNLAFELLSRIFEIAIEQQNEANYYIRPPPFQIVVSHVCRYWRDVALSSPSFWTTIFFPRLAWPPPELISLLVERSKPLPIDIHVNPEKYKMRDDPLKFPYHSLLPHIHRWCSLKVDFETREHELSFLNTLSHPSVSAASQLTTIILHRPNHCPVTSKRFTLFNGSAPRLTTIILWGVLVDWDQLWISSASNLTTLELGSHRDHNRPSWAQFSAALRGAPALQKLVLCWSGSSGQPTSWVSNGGPVIPLFNLTEFVLAWERPAHAIGYLCMFCMPALRKLTLHLETHDYTNFVGVLVGPATSSTVSSAAEKPHSLLRQLDQLNIFALHCTSDSQRLLYEELQDLKSLSVPLSQPWSSFPSDFLRLLLRGPLGEGGPPVLLPGLDSLLILMDHYDYEPAREVVQQRKDAGFPLKSLFLDRGLALRNDPGLTKWFTENVEEFDPSVYSIRYDHDPWYSHSYPHRTS